MSHARYHHGDLRNALLEAADALLEEKGLGGLTLRACARAAGVSHAAPAHHFGDIKGLLSALAERGYKRLTSMLNEALAAVAGDLHEEMLATAQAYVEFAERYPEHFRIMFRSDLVGFPGDTRPDSIRATFATLTNVILRQRGDAEIPLEDFFEPMPECLIDDIIMGWCHIHGYAHLKLEGQLGMIAEDNHAMHMQTAAHRLADLLQARHTPRANANSTS